MESFSAQYVMLNVPTLYGAIGKVMLEWNYIPLAFRAGRTILNSHIRGKGG